VEVLLEVALKIAKLYHPQSEIRTGSHLGVWTPRGKVASVGVQVEEGVLLHGVSVNGYQTEQSFVGLRPCGTDEPVDYLLSSASEAEFLRLRDRLIAETLKRLWRRPKMTSQFARSGQQGLTHDAGQIINGSEPSLLIGS
jgi:lipoate-protein ligase B